MPNSRDTQTLPTPWERFLEEVDRLIPQAVELHCVGGFVIAIRYGFPRPTAEVDYICIRPPEEVKHLQEIAGQGSRLNRKHGLYFQYVTVTTSPENYEDRLVEMFPGRLRNLRIFALDPYDLALSKLERNSPQDREDVAYLAKRVPLDFQVLELRYTEELRPYLTNLERHDQTLEFWREALFPFAP